MSKIKLPKLNSAKFLYELHTMNNNIDGMLEKAIGYTDSTDVPLYRKQCVSVMFEDMNDEREKWWVHLGYSTFNAHFEDENKKDKLVQPEQSEEDWAIECSRIMLIHELEFQKQSFYKEQYGGLQDNLESVKTDDLMYFVRVKGDKESGWWAYSKEQSEREPSNVKCVNPVGGYHYKDFTKKPQIWSHKNEERNNIWIDSEYEFMIAKDWNECEDD